MSTVALIGVAVTGIAMLLVLVAVVKLEAFVSLILTSMVVALLAGIPITEIISAIEEGMGSTLGAIAIIIGFGAMFGEMLRVSGGTKQLATTLVDRFGEQWAPWAMGLTGFLVSISVFFDVGLIVLLPLAYSLTQRSGRSLLYYALPLGAGLAATHGYIPPTPGPTAIAAELNVDLGWVILFGLIAGIPALWVGGIVFSRFIAERIHIPVPENVREEEEESQETPDPPSFGLVISLILFPLVLILIGTLTGVALPEGSPTRSFFAFAGHPFTALLLASLLIFYVLGVRRGRSMEEVQKIATKALEPVALVLLVTGAGGVFGNVLQQSGVGEAIANLMSTSGLPPILLAFLIATMVRVAQGSATVSMVTAAGLVAPAIQQQGLSAPAVGLIAIAIASGATVLSHVNDSGFWLVNRFLDMSVADTLKSWTVSVTLVGVTGFLVVFVLSFFIR